MHRVDLASLINKPYECPFCGASAKVWEDLEKYTVICTGRKCIIDRTKYYKTADEAVSRWNERVYK